MFSEILRRARTYATLAQDDKGESARSAFSPVTLSGAASGNASRAVERVLRASAPATNSFAVFGTALRSIQDPSTDARDDKDGFCFQRSFGSLHSLRMTGRRGLLNRDDRRGHPHAKMVNVECRM